MPLNNALREVQEDAFDVFPVLIELLGFAFRLVEVSVHDGLKLIVLLQCLGDEEWLTE